MQSVSQRIRQGILEKTPVLYAGLLYALAGFSTFSIAGTDTTIIFLYAVCLLNLLGTRKYWQVPKRLWWGFLAFIFFMWLAGFVSPYEQGGGVALISTWRLYLPFILFLALPHVDLARWFRIFSIFLSLIAIYGIIQFFTGVDWLRPPERSLATPYKLPSFGATNIFHAKGNFTHHLTYGGYLLLIFPSMAMLAFCRPLSLPTRRWYGLVVGLMLCAVVLSLARSVWIGSLVACYLLSFRFSRKLPLILGIAGGLVFMVMVANYTLPNKSVQQTDTKWGLVWQRLTSSFMPIHNQDRFLMWEAGWSAIQDHLLLGIGPRNNAQVLPQYRDPISQRTGHRFFNSASAGVHNIYLQIWIYAGIVGLLSYLAIWMLFIHHNWQALRQSPQGWGFYPSLLLGGLAGIVGFLVAGIFENNFLDGEVQTAVMMILGLSFYSQTQVRSSDTDA